MSFLMVTEAQRGLVRDSPGHMERKWLTHTQSSLEGVLRVGHGTLGSTPLLLPAQRTLTCQGASGCRDPKETSRSQEQGPCVNADLL